MTAATRTHEAARTAFRATFGSLPQVVTSAPGRINLLGEHTDYNQGFVLPTTLPRFTTVALAPRVDARVEVWSEALREREAFELGREHRRGTWVDYVQGVTRAAREHDHRLLGFDAWIGTELPLGGGLSSSAALEVALLRALQEAFSWSMSGVALAQLAQWGENHVVGARVGILDPLACHLADGTHALFVDTRSLEYERIPLPEQTALVVVDSGVRHAHATGGYQQRRAECEAAARALGVASLRDVTLPADAAMRALPAPLDRRLKHVLTENERVVAAVEAMRKQDVATLGTLFTASHISMRDDYEVSVPEVDRIVEAAVMADGVWGARLTGGGFGGAVICLVQAGAAEQVASALAPLGAGTLIAGRAEGAP